MGAGDRNGGDGGGFGAEDSWAEGDGGPRVGGEKGHFVGSPAAFGADGQGELRGLGEGLREGEGLLGFAEEDAEGGLLLLESQLERSWVGDLGDGGAAGLLGGFVGDAAPAFDALGGGLGQVLFGAAGEDWRDAGDAEFGSFFDGPLEVVEFEDGEQQMNGQGRIGLQLFEQDELNLAIGNSGDLGAMQESIGDYVVCLAGLGAEDAGEMSSLLAGKRGMGGVPVVGRERVGDKAAAHKGSCWLLVVSDQVSGVRPQSSQPTTNS